ncbi:MAG: hypothetical protein F4X54_07400 [Chloroflexi bacterium]|nr:hypothetical protein [Chloroflexota bacterium]
MRDLRGASSIRDYLDGRGHCTRCGEDRVAFAFLQSIAGPPSPPPMLAHDELWCAACTAHYRLEARFRQPLGWLGRLLGIRYRMKMRIEGPLEDT